MDGNAAAYAVKLEQAVKLFGTFPRQKIIDGSSIYAERTLQVCKGRVHVPDVVIGQFPQYPVQKGAVWVVRVVKLRDDIIASGNVAFVVDFHVVQHRLPKLRLAKGGAGDGLHGVVAVIDVYPYFKILVYFLHPDQLQVDDLVPQPFLLPVHGLVNLERKLVGGIQIFLIRNAGRVDVRQGTEMFLASRGQHDGRLFQRFKSFINYFFQMKSLLFSVFM